MNVEGLSVLTVAVIKYISTSNTLIKDINNRTEFNEWLCDGYLIIIFACSFILIQDVYLLIEQSKISVQSRSIKAMSRLFQQYLITFCESFILLPQRGITLVKKS